MQAIENQSAAMLGAILAELQRQRVHDDLWTAEDVAAYLKLSKSRVQARVVCNANFPRPVVIPTTDDGGGKRWVAKEVRAWALRHR